MENLEALNGGAKQQRVITGARGFALIESAVTCSSLVATFLSGNNPWQQHHLLATIVMAMEASARITLQRNGRSSDMHPQQVTVDNIRRVFQVQ